MLSLALLFVLVFSSVHSEIVINSLGEERAGVCASRALFNYFAHVYSCPFSLPLGVMGGLRLVSVAFPVRFYKRF